MTLSKYLELYEDYFRLRYLIAMNENEDEADRIRRKWGEDLKIHFSKQLLHEGETFVRTFEVLPSVVREYVDKNIDALKKIVGDKGEVSFASYGKGIGAWQILFDDPLGSFPTIYEGVNVIVEYRIGCF